MADESISSSDRGEYWLERTRFSSAFFSLSEAIGLVEAWVLPKGVERQAVQSPQHPSGPPPPPPRHTHTPPFTLVGEHPNDDGSSFEGTVFKGPAESYGSVLEGLAEPLGPVLEGPTEPLDAFQGIGRTSKTFLWLWTLHWLTENLGVSQCWPQLPGRSLSASWHQSGPARSTHTWQNHPEWVVWKKPKSVTSDTPQILSLSWWRQQWHMTFHLRPQLASWLLPTVWLPERSCIFQRRCV